MNIPLGLCIVLTIIVNDLFIFLIFWLISKLGPDFGSYHIEKYGHERPVTLQDLKFRKTTWEKIGGIPYDEYIKDDNKRNIPFINKKGFIKTIKPKH